MFCRGQHRSPAQRAKSSRRQALFWTRKHETLAASSSPQPAFLEPESQPAPHPTVDQEPESQPGPDPAADSETLTEQNHTLKRQHREAVRVGNGCYYALERTKAEASERERERKLRWALLIERSAHAQTKSNPKGIQLSPTAEEVQARLAEEEERQKQAEHKSLPAALYPPRPLDPALHLRGGRAVLPHGTE